MKNEDFKGIGRFSTIFEENPTFLGVNFNYFRINGIDYEI